MKSHLSSPWSELLLFNFTGYVNNADFIPVPPSSEPCICYTWFHFIFLKSRTLIILLQSHCPPCFFSNMPSMALLPGLAFLFAATGKCSSCRVCTACPCSTFRSPSHVTLQAAFTCTFSGVPALSSSLSYTVYDYYLSFSLGYKLLEYEDFITVVYCCSICDQHSKL